MARLGVPIASVGPLWERRFIAAVRAPNVRDRGGEEHQSVTGANHNLAAGRRHGTISRDRHGDPTGWPRDLVHTGISSSRPFTDQDFDKFVTLQWRGGNPDLTRRVSSRPLGGEASGDQLAGSPVDAAK